jgi:hypothetical protein
VSKNVLPFALIHPLLVVLPLVSERNGDENNFILVSNEELLRRGARFASRWFATAERLWEAHKTDKAKVDGMSYLDRLDFQHGLTEQNPDARYLVIYTGSATDACAAVVDREKFDAPFVAEHKTYWSQVASLEEGNYLCAFLNSGYANDKIKDFQSRGLFGPRDIHKTIVKLPFPHFDGRIEEHRALACLSQKCADAAGRLLAREGVQDLDARTLGRMRTKLREYLDEELSSIDQLVEQLSTGKYQKQQSGRLGKGGDADDLVHCGYSTEMKPMKLTASLVTLVVIFPSFH